MDCRASLAMTGGRDPTSVIANEARQSSRQIKKLP